MYKSYIMLFNSILLKASRFSVVFLRAVVYNNLPVPEVNLSHQDVLLHVEDLGPDLVAEGRVFLYGFIQELLNTQHN